MILLITSSKRAAECAAALQQATGEPVRVAASLRRGLTLLRTGDYTTVALDEALAQIDCTAFESVAQRAGTAMPVQVNLAISGAERVVREVRAALRRRECERVIAMQAAEATLRSEVRGALTGILLSADLALHVPELPAAAEAKLRAVHALAEQLRARFEPGAC